MDGWPLIAASLQMATLLRLALEADGKLRELGFGTFAGHADFVAQKSQRLSHAECGFVKRAGEGSLDSDALATAPGLDAAPAGLGLAAVGERALSTAGESTGTATVGLAGADSQGTYVQL